MNDEKRFRIYSEDIHVGFGRIISNDMWYHDVEAEWLEEYSDVLNQQFQCLNAKEVMSDFTRGYKLRLQWDNGNEEQFLVLGLFDGELFTRMHFLSDSVNWLLGNVKSPKLG